MNQKRKLGKRIAAWLLCMVMVFSSVNLPGFTLTVFAAGTDIQNVNIDADGIMTWDAFPGANEYYFEIGSGGGYVDGTSINLYQCLESYGKTSGTYTVRLNARDTNRAKISTTYITEYIYIAKNAQLGVPTNFKWNGTTVSWDSVPNATSYNVFIYKDTSFLTSDVVNDTSIDIAGFLKEGTNDYKVQVSAMAEGYPFSEFSEFSESHTLTKELPEITGVSIAEDGTMSWNALAGASKYRISMSSFSKTANGTSINLKEALKENGKSSGEYNVTLEALDSSDKQVAKKWNGIYNYTAPAPLDAPTNFVWNDKTVTWNPVTNATSYQVVLYRDQFAGGSAIETFTTDEASFEIPRRYLNEGTNSYGVLVYALSDEYPNSEYGESGFHEITYLKPSIQSVLMNDGILSWDALTSAKDYIVNISGDDEEYSTEETFFDVDSVLMSHTKPNGEYSITLSARDNEENVISTTTLIKYQYIIKYDISVEASDENGSVSGSGRYQEGSTVTVKAFPKEGYLFVYWTDELGDKIADAGKEYSFTVDSSSNLKYVANFIACTHEYVKKDNQYHECSVCGKKEAHDFDGQPYSVSAKGKHVQKCKYCEATKESDCVAGEAVEENRVEPGARTKGSYDEVKYCIYCGQELTRENKEIASTETLITKIDISSVDKLHAGDPVSGTGLKEQITVTTNPLDATTVKEVFLLDVATGTKATKIVEGHKYRLTVVLDGKSGFYFDESEEGVTVDENGYKATVLSNVIIARPASGAREYTEASPSVYEAKGLILGDANFGDTLEVDLEDWVQGDEFWQEKYSAAIASETGIKCEWKFTSLIEDTVLSGYFDGEGNGKLTVGEECFGGTIHVNYTFPDGVKLHSSKDVASLIIDSLYINYTTSNNKPNCKVVDLYNEIDNCFNSRVIDNGSGKHVALVDDITIFSYTGPGKTGTREQIGKSSDATKLINPDLHYYLSLDLKANIGYDFGHDERNFLDTESVKFVVNGTEMENIALPDYNYVHKSISIQIPIEIDLSDKVYSVTISNSEINVEKGSAVQFTSDVVYHGSGFGGVDWTVEGATSAGTNISSDGLLTIADDETAHSITIKATSVKDSTIFDTRVLTVMDTVSIDSVSIDKVTASVLPNKTIDFTATVVGTDAHDVTWTLTGNNSENTTITPNDKNCTLKVGKDEIATELRLRVTSVKDSTKYAESVITILPVSEIDKLDIRYTTNKALVGVKESELYSELLGCLRGKAISNGSGIDVAKVDNIGLYTFTDADMSGTKVQVNIDSAFPIKSELYYYLNLVIIPAEGYDFKHDGSTFDTESVKFNINGTEISGVATESYNEAWKTISIWVPIEVKVTCNHDFSKYVSNADGTHKVVCKDCGAVQPGHEEEACSGGTATCKAKAKCSKCGAEYGSLAVHTGGTATCKVKAKCTVCGKEYGELAAHKYDTKWSTDATNHWKACTVCGTKKDSAAHADANKDGKCDTCSYSMHTHAGTKVAQVDATCTSYGVKAYYKCSCGKYYTDSTCTKEITDLAAWKKGDGRIAKKDHTYDTKWSSDGTNHWHECTVCGAKKDSAAHTLKTTTTKATLTANGKKETKCSVCGKVTKTETIYAAKTIKLSATKYTYDGKVKKPSVTIKDSKGNAIASTNYTVTYPSGRKNVGKYTVKVTFKGNYSGSKNLTFTINPPKTSISKLTAGKKAFTVKWTKKTTQVTGYEIQYSTSSTFAKGNKTIKVTSAKTVSKTISKLTGGKKYYVRIRTYKTVNKVKYYSDWSAKKSVTTKK